WITDRVAYDAESYLEGRTSDVDCRAEAVLTHRLTICEGYATLFQALCTQAGVEAVKVSGFAKGFGYHLGEPVDRTRTDHSWNAVKLDGRWHLLDATWGAGDLVGAKFVKEFDDFYFLTPPDSLIFSHLPSDSRWQLVDPLVSQDEFFREIK